ncbi:MAG: EF2563 family selenium-dependent molybdenum hydroxylase system protein [Gammaproteobacteria bacterium]|nr:EF2563 family selenium-dependent molybdenum hydroxylase system protein [Gammaproteobacteria bacterium]
MGNKPRVLIRGGGDLASGVAARLHRAGFGILVTELEQPLVVRRLVSFAQAIYSVSVQVEEITGRKAADLDEARRIINQDQIAVLVDPELANLEQFSPLVLVDARMRKKPPEIGMDAAPLVIGLGPGFSAGKNCHALVETMRGHFLGRVIWEGEALPNTGIPDPVGGKSYERVLRAPKDGKLKTGVSIGDQVQEGEIIAIVADEILRAPFNGVVRGLLKDDVFVSAGLKIGDLDPRGNPDYARLVSDKSLSIGGGVLEAILSREEFRKRLYAPD